jgi:hypothetical protein
VWCGCVTYYTTLCPQLTQGGGSSLVVGELHSLVERANEYSKFGGSRFKGNDLAGTGGCDPAIVTSKSLIEVSMVLQVVSGRN